MGTERYRTDRETEKISEERFRLLYQYDLYKGNSSVFQIIAQAEVDVIGLSFDNDEIKVHAVDVAFHESGLNYGSREETVARVIKKCLRTAMCVYGYLGLTTGTIVFASPKINPAVYADLEKALPEIEAVLKAADMTFHVRIICNENFKSKILEPVVDVLDDVADTSELFMRSLQMYNLFAVKRAKSTSMTQSPKVDNRRCGAVPIRPKSRLWQPVLQLSRQPIMILLSSHSPSGNQSIAGNEGSRRRSRRG